MNASGNPFRGSRCRFLCAAALVALVAGGCRTPRPDASKTPAPQPGWRYYGRIIKVNQPRHYVVLECTVLPSPGEEVKVFRNGKPVGRLRAGQRSHSPFITADVLEGSPRPGDLILDWGLPKNQMLEGGR